VKRQKEKEIIMQDSKLRFSDRVQDYKKYRPTYPLESIKFAKNQCEIKYDWRIADIGSGAGISTEGLLKVFECPVYAVEPNNNMRSEAENKLDSVSITNTSCRCRGQAVFSVFVSQ
jgi:trans-aconitate methyltransferase